jgi:hypothetical protein
MYNTHTHFYHYWMSHSSNINVITSIITSLELVETVFSKNRLFMLHPVDFLD